MTVDNFLDLMIEGEYSEFYIYAFDNEPVFKGFGIDIPDEYRNATIVFFDVGTEAISILIKPNKQVIGSAAISSGKDKTMRRYVIEYRISSASEWELDTNHSWNKDVMEVKAKNAKDAIKIVKNKLIAVNMKKEGYMTNYYNDDTVMICKPDGSLHEAYSDFNIVKRI